MDRGPAIALTLLVGGLVAFQPPANAALSRHVGDLGATLISLTIAWVIIAALLVAIGDPGELRRISGFRAEHLLGGVAGAAVVYVSIVTVRPLGAGGVAAALVAGQLIVAVVLDRLGFLGLETLGVTPARAAGIGLLIVGALLVTSH